MSDTQNRRRYDNDPDLEASFAKCPKFGRHELSDSQIEEIATRAADKAADRAAVKAVELAKQGFYAGVGKSVMGKLYWLVGLIIVGTALWFQKNGWIKL